MNNKFLDTEDLKSCPYCNKKLCLDDRKKRVSDGLLVCPYCNKLILNKLKVN
jgi:uncharacterized Zn-finger protein